MSISINLNGTTYELPTSGETDWGPALVRFFQGVAAADRDLRESTGPTLLTFGNSSVVAGGGTKYLNPQFAASAAGEVELTVVMPFAGKITGLGARINEAAALMQFAVRVNNAETNAHMFLTAGQTSTFNGLLGAEVEFEAGDRLGVRCYVDSGTAYNPICTVAISLL